jgi:hypothetical protein
MTSHRQGFVSYEDHTRLESYKSGPCPVFSHRSAHHIAGNMWKALLYCLFGKNGTKYIYSSILNLLYQIYIFIEYLETQ